MTRSNASAPSIEPCGLHQPGADLELVGAQPQDQVVELAGHRQRPEVGAEGVDALERLGHGVGLGAEHRDRRGARAAVDVAAHVGVADRVLGDLAGQRRQADAVTIGGAVRPRRGLRRALAHRRVPLLARHRLVDELPVDGLGPLEALGLGGEDVGAVLADVALVGDAGEAAGAGQHAEQRHLGQRDGAGPVVDQQDRLAGEGHLVAAARRGAVERGHPGLARVRAHVLDAVARLVGELAEVHLPGVARLGQHPDVRPGAEVGLLAAGEHHAAHLGVGEAQPLGEVVELDVDAQVVRVQLELVAGHQPAVLGDVEVDPGGLTLDLVPPVAVARGVGVEVDLRRGVGTGSLRGGRSVLENGHGGGPPLSCGPHSTRIRRQCIEL